MWASRRLGGGQHARGRLAGIWCARRGSRWHAGLGGGGIKHLQPGTRGAWVSNSGQGGESKHAGLTSEIPANNDRNRRLDACAMLVHKPSSIALSMQDKQRKATRSSALSQSNQPVRLHKQTGSQLPHQPWARWARRSPVITMGGGAALVSGTRLTDQQD